MAARAVPGSSRSPSAATSAAACSVRLPAPSAEEVRTLTEKIAARITRRVRKLVEEEEAGGTRLEETALSLESSLLAAMRVPVPDARFLFGDGDHESEGSGGAGLADTRRPRLCAKVAGFSLHAGRTVDATDRSDHFSPTAFPAAGVSVHEPGTHAATDSSAGRTVSMPRKLERAICARLAVLVGGLLLGSSASPAGADGDYVLTWSSLDAGGSTSLAAGDYLLSGTLGQPEAATVLTAGEYLLRPGFWVLEGQTSAGLPAPGATMPARFALAIPVPSPFRDTTTFAIDVPQASRLTLDVFSVDGRQIRRVLDESVGAGQVRARWDGRDDQARQVADGIYFVRARLGSEEKTVRVVRVVP